MMGNRGIRKLAAVGCALCLCIGTLESATAALLFPSGNPHPDAIPGFSGTVQLQDDPDNNPTTTNQYYGDIEYAVFTAANFAANFPGEDTPAGGVAAGEIVYAFQVYNAGVRGDITQFSAGLADLASPTHHGDGDDDNELVVAADLDFIAGSGDKDPNLISAVASGVHGPTGSNSARYNFTGAPASRLNSGEWSSVLFYTSPFLPGWDNGSTTSGQGQSRIPGPEVPEPASLALVFTAVAALTLRRRGR